MTTEFLLSAGAAFVSLVAAALGLRKHDAGKKSAEALARRTQGLEYARAAWAVVLHRKTAPSAQRAALLDAFRLHDVAMDGRRDFTDAQASVFLDEVAKEFQP